MKSGAAKRGKSENPILRRVEDFDENAVKGWGDKTT